jgi:Mg2+/Co2+ transporter CorB
VSYIENILKLLKTTQHTLLPAYYSDINNVQGILHMRDVGNMIKKSDFDITDILKSLKQPYFIPEGTSLFTQLVNFQKNKLSFALVVDEYGDVQGIITLEDILEEIVGKFTTDVTDITPEIFPQADGSVLVDASINVRNLNRNLHCTLPTEGAKTLSGLIIDYLEFIPEPATCVKINGYALEVLQVQDNMVKTVKFYK